MELTNKEKLELINSMEIVDSSFASGECEYILVEDNVVNREILHKIGVTDKDVEDEGIAEDGEIDISFIGFEYADYFSGKLKKFMKD